MKKTFIAITAASAILTGCASVQNYDEVLNVNTYSYVSSAEHSDAMNLMMKAFDVEPKNPNNLDEFTGDYHSRLARRSNVTGGAFSAMSLIGGAGLGTSLLTGAIHSPTDQMQFHVKFHWMFRVLPVESHESLPMVVANNRDDVVSSVRSTLDDLGYDTTHYKHTLDLFLGTNKYSDESDFFVRNDLPQCEVIHQQVSNGSLTYMDTVRSTKESHLFNTCAFYLNDSESRLVYQHNDEDNSQAQMYYVWAARPFHIVNSAWHIETFNALALDDKTFLYTPSYYWLPSRNSWAEVDVDTMDSAIEHGVISPTPRLKVLDGTGSELPFGLNDEV
ncbi:hypothetical protein [Photobacterium satsumensis]|uniref:hypothetical protein n=1 Tax=Photobacterium satsumensis TaxID=2910239 RepID=UPI003D0B64AE